jgi:hypothetical protein
MNCVRVQRCARGAIERTRECSCCMSARTLAEGAKAQMANGTHEPRHGGGWSDVAQVRINTADAGQSGPLNHHNQRCVSTCLPLLTFHGLNSLTFTPATTAARFPRTCASTHFSAAVGPSKGWPCRDFGSREPSTSGTSPLARTFTTSHAAASDLEDCTIFTFCVPAVSTVRNAKLLDRLQRR